MNDIADNYISVHSPILYAYGKDHLMFGVVLGFVSNTKCLVHLFLESGLGFETDTPIIIDQDKLYVMDHMPNKYLEIMYKAMFNE